MTEKFLRVGCHFVIYRAAMDESSQKQLVVQGQNRPVMLSEKVREALRLKHYSLRTEEAYLGWLRRYIRFHHGRNPRENLSENGSVGHLG